MILTLNDIKKITFGAVSVYENNGFVIFERFTEKQKDCYKKYRTLSLHNKVNATASVKIAFKSNTDYLKFDYILDYASSREYAYFDVLVNGNIVYSTGTDKIDVSEKILEVNFEKGEKSIEIYFPWSMRAKIKNFEISDNASIIPKKHSKIMLAYGDSITQGYDSIHPSYAYINQLAKALDSELFNKAIGGDTFFPELLEAKDGFFPDIVTVAYGTNDWLKCSYGEFVFNTKTFFEMLYENYKNTKIYVITPIWKLSEEDGTKPMVNISFAEHRLFIKNTALQYENITVIDGDYLVPHDTALFADKILHPNDDGFSFYSKNLIEKIKKLF